MDAATVNRLLRRELKPFDKWVDLIPAYEGSQYDFEAPNQYSDTDDTLVFMANCVEKTAHQLVKVAPLLKGNTLTETVDNIYKWLYNHFQYKLDETTLQHLYKPSAAVYYRKIGFDCKTFSTLASSLLSLLKIPHAFRKVKQKGFVHPVTGELVWSHVYVVVPNGSQTLVVDATTHNNREVSFVEKYDYDMTKVLKHVMLGSPAVTAQQNPYTLDMYGGLACPGQTCNCGGSGSLGNPYAYGYDLNALYTLPEMGTTGLNGSISLSTVTSYFNTPISCWGGSAFSGEQAEATAKAIVNYFDAEIAKINTAVKNGDVAALSDLDNKFFAWSNGAKHAYMAKLTRGWNKCTTESSNRMIKILEFYELVVYKALDGWLKQYFDITDTGQKIRRYGHVYEPPPANFYFSYEPNDWRESPVRTFRAKPTTLGIKAFEITPYIEQVASGQTAFNLQTYLQGLNTILVAAQQVTGGGTQNQGSTDSGTYDASTGAYTGDPKTPKPQTAGMGWLIGGAIALAGFSLYSSSKKSKPNAK